MIDSPQKNEMLQERPPCSFLMHYLDDIWCVQISTLQGAFWSYAQWEEFHFEWHFSGHFYALKRQSFGSPGRSERCERSPILLGACPVQLEENCQNGRERSESLKYESLYLRRAKRASIHVTIVALREIHAVSDAIWFLCKYGRWGRACELPALR